MDFSILRITVKPPTTSLNSQYALKAGAYSSRGRKQQETLRTTHRTPSERQIHIKLTWPPGLRLSGPTAEMFQRAETQHHPKTAIPPQELCSSSPPTGYRRPQPASGRRRARLPRRPLTEKGPSSTPAPRGSGPRACRWGSRRRGVPGRWWRGPGGGQRRRRRDGRGGTAWRDGSGDSNDLQCTPPARDHPWEVSRDFPPTLMGSLARFPSRLWEVSRDLELTSPLVTAGRPLPSNQAGRAGCSGGRRLSRHGGGGALRAPAPLQHPQPAAAVSPAGGAPLPVPAG